VFEQPAADDRTECDAHAGRGAPDADGLGALGTVREHVRQEVSLVAIGATRIWLR
jgi:hypothetical protein